MRLLQPPGDRSTNRGAPHWTTPEAARRDTGMADYLNTLPPTIRADLRLDLTEKTQAALRGELGFCTCTGRRRCAAVTHDVKQSASRPRVLELRSQATVDDTGRRAVGRLYFTEPETIDELTYLLFRAKYPDDPDAHAQQTEHMAEADDIITAHFDVPARSHDE